MYKNGVKHYPKILAGIIKNEALLRGKVRAGRGKGFIRLHELSGGNLGLSTRRRNRGGGGISGLEQRPQRPDPRRHENSEEQAGENKDVFFQRPYPVNGDKKEKPGQYKIYGPAGPRKKREREQRRQLLRADLPPPAIG